jgi:hypothetical protein
MPTSSPTASVLKAVRLTHHYLGIFIAPAILFFAFTGFLQMFSFHETTRGSSYTPPAIFVHLAQLHKKATLITPQRKAPKPDAPKPDAPKPEAPKSAAPKLDAPKPDAPAAPPAKLSSLPVLSNLPMRLFFGLIAIGLFTSTLTGLFMAWKYNRSKPLVAGVFVAGIALPLLLLLLQ